MDEATKYLLGQGVLGVVCVFLGIFNWIQWKENRNLTDRLEAKAEKHAEKNIESAQKMAAVFEAAIRSAENRPRSRRLTATQKAVEEEGGGT